MPKPERDLTATLLGVLFLGVLIVAAFWIVRPFLAAAIWALMIVIVTWPTLLRIQARLWNSRGLAIAVMIVLLILLFVVPLTLAAGTVVANADDIAARAQAVAAFRMPVAPRWVAALPFVGARIARAWQDTAAAGFDGLWARLVPYAGSATAWIVARAGNVGYLAVEFLLTLLLAAFLYLKGEAAAAAALRLAHRVGAAQGEELVRLAAQAVRGVAVGVGLTAVVQSVLGGLGLAIAGVPFAGALTAVMFMLCIAQIGMLVVLIPAVAWVYWNGHPALGTLLLVWSLAAALLDNFLRPVLVRRSADLPLLLVSAGVVEGLIAYGPVGIFIGPVVLAVGYTLLLAWIGRGPSQAPTDDA